MQKLRVVSFIAAVVFPVAAVAGLLGAKNFDDCILESMKGATSDRAAALIARSCRKKFPSAELSYTQLQNLTGRAGKSSYDNTFSGSLYNGNTDIVVTEVTIGVTTTISGKEVTRDYTTTFLTIQPQSTGQFFIKIIAGDEGADYSWSIRGARGD